MRIERILVSAARQSTVYRARSSGLARSGSSRRAPPQRPSGNASRLQATLGDEIVPKTQPAGLLVASFAQRPDLRDKVFGPEIQSAVPEFMRHDPTAALYYGNGQLDLYQEFGLVAVDPAQPDRPLARAFSVPFAFRDGTKGREELPDGGWDAVIRWADQDRRAGRSATAVSALEIMVARVCNGVASRG